MSGSVMSNLVRLSRRGLLSVRGRDAPEFLNGMLAATIAKPPRIAPGYSVILNAQGRILYDVFVHLHPEFANEPAPHFILEYSSATPVSSASEDGTQSPTSIPTLPKLLRRHLLRSDVRIRDLTPEYDVWAAWTEPHTAEREWQWSVARSGVIEPVFDAGVEGTDGAGVWGGPGLLKDRRSAGMGTRRLVRKGDKPLEHETHDLKTLKSYLLHRIRHGVPEGPIDLPPGQAFPFESNIDMMGGVSVRKGCYIGQELTSRTYHTGVVRKRIVPVTLRPDPSSTADDPSPSFRPHISIKASHLTPPGDSGSPKRPRPRGTGKLLTNTDGHGLALLRLEHVEAALRGELALELDYNSEQGDVTLGLSDEWAGGELDVDNSARPLEDEKRRWLVQPQWQDGLPASKDEVESTSNA